jgi:hypothetical protein
MRIHGKSIGTHMIDPLRAALAGGTFVNVNCCGSISAARKGSKQDSS